MSKHTQDPSPGNDREIMKGQDGHGQNTAGDREIMKGEHGKGQNSAGDHEIMEEAPTEKQSRPG